MSSSMLPKWARKTPKHRLKKASSDTEAQECLQEVAGAISNILELGYDDDFGALRIGERSMRTSPAEGVRLLGKEYKRLYKERQNLGNRLTSLEQEHKRTERLLEEADDRHYTAMAIERSNHETKLDQMKRDHDNLVDTITEKSQQNMKNQKTHYENTIAQLKRSNQQKIDRLQKEVQSRNKALVERDTFVSISDADIKTEVSQLMVEVEDWARITWQFNNSPWTEEMQRKIAKVPKRLQKHILMDSIWTIFYEHIFGNPFRVLGTQGQKLEKQWSSAFGKGSEPKGAGYIWPDPGFDAEQWRYNTLRPCLEALQIATSEHDHRTKLRRGVEESLAIVQQKLIETFQMVTTLDEAKRQALYQLAEKAARMWVLFGAQRYRLVVGVQDLPTSMESVGSLVEGGQTIDFVLRPEVRRIGDVDGESLSKELIVSGCEGEASRVTY